MTLAPEALAALGSLKIRNSRHLRRGQVIIAKDGNPVWMGLLKDLPVGLDVDEVVMNEDDRVELECDIAEDAVPILRQQES